MTVCDTTLDAISGPGLLRPRDFADVGGNKLPDTPSGPQLLRPEDTGDSLEITTKPEAKPKARWWTWESISSKPLTRQIFGPIRKAAIAIPLAWGTIWGGATGVDAIIGEPAQPVMNDIMYEHPRLWKINTTANLSSDILENPGKHTSEDLWEALQPTVALMKELSPEVHLWLLDMKEQGNIVFHQNHNDNARDVFSFDQISGKLNVYPSGFSHPDGEKLAFLVHEYCHSRQNGAEILAHYISPKNVLGRHLGGLALKLGAEQHFRGFQEKLSSWLYGSQIEDEAHLWEVEAKRHIGLQPESQYLAQRGIHPAPNEKRHPYVAMVQRMDELDMVEQPETSEMLARR